MPGGRPKGSKNKKLKADSWKMLEAKMSTEFTQKYINLMDIYYHDDPEKFMKCYETMTRYFKPILKSAEIKMNGDIQINLIGEKIEKI